MIATAADRCVDRLRRRAARNIGNYKELNVLMADDGTSRRWKPA